MAKDKVKPKYNKKQQPVTSGVEMVPQQQSAGSVFGGSVQEEITDKTIKMSDKVKVARVIGDMLGVENVENISPDVAVNTGLRKVKNKRMTPELISVIKKMLALASEVGIKVDHSLIPKAVAEGYVPDSAERNRPELPQKDKMTLAKLHDLMKKEKEKKAKQEGVIQRSGTDKVTEEVELEEAAKGHTMEAHGVKGMKNTPWRKTFKSHEHAYEWAEKNDAEIHGTRDLEHPVKEEIELEEDIWKGVTKAYPETKPKDPKKEKELRASIDAAIISAVHAKRKKEQEYNKEATEHSIAKETDVIEKGGKYNSAKGIKKFSDFHKLKQITNPDGTLKPQDPNTEINGENPTETGHTYDGAGDEDQLRRRKAVYKVDEELEEDVHSADYKVNPQTGRRYRARHIEFAASRMGGTPEQGDEDGEPITRKHKAGEPLMKPVKEEHDNEHEELEDISDADLEKMAKDVDTEDEILDAYDDNELVIVDDETGEKVADIKEEVEQINEVLSRAERMRAKIRFARTSSKRARRLKVVLKTRSSSATINRRARHLAVNLIKQRLFKKPVSQMTVGEKERAERMIAKRKNLINRLAMKLAPRVRKIENERLSHSKVTK